MEPHFTRPALTSYFANQNRNSDRSHSGDEPVATKEPHRARPGRIRQAVGLALIALGEHLADRATGASQESPRIDATTRPT